MKSAEKSAHSAALGQIKKGGINLSHRLRIAIASIAVTAGLVAAAPLLAEDYPTRPVTIIVASTPGGGTDIVSRIVGEQLSKQLGQPFVVQNLPGAGSLTGTEVAAKAAPDGYTLQTGTQCQHGGKSEPVCSHAL